MPKTSKNLHTEHPGCSEPHRISEPYRSSKPRRDAVAGVAVIAIVACFLAMAVASAQENQPPDAPVASERGPALVEALRRRYRAVTSLAIDLEITTLVHGHLMVDRGWIRFRTSASEIGIGGTIAKPSLHRLRSGDRWRRDDGPWKTVPLTRPASLVSPLVSVFDALVVENAVLVGTQTRRGGASKAKGAGPSPREAEAGHVEGAPDAHVEQGTGSSAPLVIEAPLRQGLGPFRMARLVIDEAGLRLLAIELLSERGDALLQCVLHSERGLDPSEALPSPPEASTRSTEDAKPAPSGSSSRPRRIR